VSQDSFFWLPSPNIVMHKSNIYWDFFICKN